MSFASPDTSLSLLGRLGTGDGDAWGRLVVVYSGLMQKWLASAGLQPADRDDLTQRALEILLREMPGFQHSGRPGSFRAWLRSIVVNLLREFWRRRRPAGADSVLAQVSDPHTSLSRYWDAEHDRRLLAALLNQVEPAFTETSWRAFSRTALDGVPARVVGAELGLTVNAVLIAKSRVLARLRQEAEALPD